MCPIYTAELSQRINEKKVSSSSYGSGIQYGKLLVVLTFQMQLEELHNSQEE